MPKQYESMRGITQESRNSYVARAVPILMGEGLTRDQAVGKAEGMYTSMRRRSRTGKMRKRKVARET